MTVPLNPFLQAILGPGMLPPAAPLPVPQPGAPDAIPLTGDWASANAMGKAAIDNAAAEAYSAPGGYHPRNDIVEMRGQYGSLTSPYGVGVPSNASLRQQYAARDQVGIQRTIANAQATTAGAHATQAQAAADQAAYERSPEGLRARLQLAGLQVGNRPLMDAAEDAGGAMNPARSLVDQGLAASPELLPKTADEAILKYAAGGGPPLAAGSPARSAWEKQYGAAALGGRARGEAANWWERPIDAGTNVGDVLQLGIPSFVRSLSGAKPYHERVAEAAARLFPAAPTTAAVGVAGSGKPAAKPVVKGYAQQQREKRRLTYEEALRGGTGGG